MSETCDTPSVLLTIEEYSFALQQVCLSPFSRLSPAATPRSLFAAQVNEHLLKAQLRPGEETEPDTEHSEHSVCVVGGWRGGILLSYREGEKGSATRKAKCRIFLSLFNKSLTMVGASGLRECVSVFFFSARGS